MATLELRNIEKVYGNAFKAVHGIDLTVNDGEFMVLVGPSGCAKSTTLRMIAGLETVTSGEIRIGGKVVNNLVPGNRGISMVFQNYALYPHMKVLKNLSFGMRLKRRPKEEIDAGIGHVTSLLEIEELLERLPKQLSGGQAQRVAVGRAIIKKPEVFLFDEPLSNLDAKLRAAMRVRITDLHKRLKQETGMSSTVVYVTHDQVEAMTMGDRICVMKDGHIMQVSDPVTLYDAPESVFVAGFIGMPEMNLVDAELTPERNAVRVGGQILEFDSGTSARIAKHAPRDITLGIRPQHLRVVSADTPKSLTGSITHSEFMGHEIYLYVRIEGHDFILVVPGDFNRSLLDGDEIHFQAIQEKLHVFDRTSGKNISLK